MSSKGQGEEKYPKHPLGRLGVEKKNFWIGVALVGGVLSLVGLGVLTRQYRQGKIARGELQTVIIGFVILAVLAIGEELWMPLPFFFLPLWLGLIVFVPRRSREIVVGLVIRGFPESLLPSDEVAVIA